MLFPIAIMIFMHHDIFSGLFIEEKRFFEGVETCFFLYKLRFACLLIIFSGLFIEAKRFLEGVETCFFLYKLRFACLLIILFGPVYRSKTFF